MTFKIKNGINIGNTVVVDANSRYQQVNPTPAKKPTLVMDFVNNPSLDSRITFNRSTNATVRTAKNIIENVPVDTPRFEYYSNGVCKGFLVEDQRTNLTTLNTTLLVDGISNWGNVQIASFRSDAVSPSGAQDAYKVVGLNNGVSGQSHYIYQYYGSLTTSNAYSGYYYVKSGEYSRCYIQFISGGAYTTPQEAQFDLSTGTYAITSGTPTAFIEDANNGWFRIGIAANTNTTGSTQLILGLVNNSNTKFFLGDNRSGLYAWGAQFEYANAYSSASTLILSNDTFTSRASNATYQDSTDGSIKFSGVNLLFPSQNTYAYGSNPIPATSTDNAVLAPDGTLTATLVNLGTASAHYIRKDAVVLASTTYTFSFYVQLGTATALAYSVYNQNASADIVASTNYYSQVAATGWTRISVTFTTPVGCTNIGLYPFRDGPSAGTAAVWGCQLELGSTATLYAKTSGSTTAAARYVYNGASNTTPLLLLEPAATNLLTYSSQFDQSSSWFVYNVILTANAAVSPSGATDAFKFVGQNGAILTNNDSQGAVGPLSNYSTSSTCTFSVYLKKAELSVVRVRERAEDGSRIYVDLNSGTLSYEVGDATRVSASIAYVANGWYRATFTRTPNASIGFELKPSGATGDGTSGFYVWGAQLEVGYGATSYIPTGAATATRAADVYSIATTTRSDDQATMTSVKSWYSSDEGTINIEFTANSGGYSWPWRSSFAENATVIGTNTIASWNGFYQLNTSTSANVINGTPVSYAVSYSQSYGRAQVINGGTIAYANSYSGGLALSGNGNDFGTPASFWFGGGGQANPNFRVINGCLRQIKYYPQAASNTEIIALTTL